jgi:hypothetical protein
VALHPDFWHAVFLPDYGWSFSSVFWMAAPIMEVISVGFDEAARWATSFAPDSLWADLAGMVWL